MLLYGFDNNSTAGWQTFNAGWLAEDGVYKGANQLPDIPVESIWSTGYSWTDYIFTADINIRERNFPSDGDLIFRYQDKSALSENL